MKRSDCVYVMDFHDLLRYIADPFRLEGMYGEREDGEIVQADSTVPDTLREMVEGREG